MGELRPINKDEWVHGDYRSVACIDRPLHTILADVKVNYYEFVADGLGPARSAFFVTPRHRQFVICEYLSTDTPLSEFLVLFDRQTVYADLDEILGLLGLGRRDLSWVVEI